MRSSGRSSRRAGTSPTTRPRRIDLAGAPEHHHEVGTDVALLASRDEPIRDPLCRSLSAAERVKCTSAWTLPEPWTQRTRPPLLGKPHKTRFPTAPTRIISQALYTRNSGHSRSARLSTSLTDDSLPSSPHQIALTFSPPARLRDTETFAILRRRQYSDRICRRGGSTTGGRSRSAPPEIRCEPQLRFATRSAKSIRISRS